MKRGLLVFLATCALAIAMVPTDSAVSPEEQTEQASVKTNITICAKTTPCAWSVYKLEAKIIDVNITNTYCVCSDDKVCIVDEDDPIMSAYVYRCRKPGHETEDS